MDQLLASASPLVRDLIGMLAISKAPEAFRAEGYAIDALTGSNDSA